MLAMEKKQGAGDNNSSGKKNSNEDSSIVNTSQDLRRDPRDGEGKKSGALSGDRCSDTTTGQGTRLSARVLQRPGIGSGSFELGQEFAGFTMNTLDSAAVGGLEPRTQEQRHDNGPGGEPGDGSKPKDTRTTGNKDGGASKSASPSSCEVANVPPSFVCPIGMDIMVDPVILATGHTYDRQSIEYWIKQGNKTCPVTGMKLRHTEMTPNFALRNAIQEWAGEHGIVLPDSRSRQREDNCVTTVCQDGVLVTEEEEDQGVVLSGHDEIVWALQKHGDCLVTASADCTVRVWDIPSKRCMYVLEDHRRPVLSLAATGSYIFSGSYDHSINVWSWASFRKVATLKGHTDAVRALIMCPCGPHSHVEYVCSGSYDGTLRLWEVGSWDCVAVLRGHTGPVRVLTACCGLIFSGSYDGTVRAWDMQQLKCLAVLKGHKSAVRALTSIGSYVCSGSDDATVRVWDAESLTCLAVLRGHEDNVRVLSATDDFVCSGSWDKTVRVWRVPGFECAAVLQGHTEAVLALTSEKDFVVSGSYDGHVRVWDTDTWSCTRCFDKHSDAVRVLASSGGRIFSGSYDGGVGII